MCKTSVTPAILSQDFAAQVYRMTKLQYATGQPKNRNPQSPGNPLRYNVEIENFPDFFCVFWKKDPL